MRFHRERLHKLHSYAQSLLANHSCIIDHKHTINYRLTTARAHNKTWFCNIPDARIVRKPDPTETWNLEPWKSSPCTTLDPFFLQPPSPPFLVKSLVRRPKRFLSSIRPDNVGHLRIRSSWPAATSVFLAFVRSNLVWILECRKRSRYVEWRKRGRCDSSRKMKRRR